jgi:hypothetical protein
MMSGRWGDRPLVAWGLEGICQTQPAAVAGEAGSGVSTIRAGYREARAIAYHVEHAYILGPRALQVYGPAGPLWRYFRTYA